MTSDFSAFVRSLGPGGEPPDARSFDQLLAMLRRALVYEMKKRSLWSAPPSYLGVYGGTSWSEGDLLEDLLLDCYAFVFVRRLPGLMKQLLVRPNVDGLVFLSLRHFLHETQKRHDPLGYRVFELTSSAVLRLVEAGTLHVLAGDPRIRNDTVLGFVPWCDAAEEEAELQRPLGGSEGGALQRHAERWNDELLPELVAAWNRDAVVERLAERLARLPEVGIEVFRFRDLVEAVKDDARARWHAIRFGEEGETAPEEPAGEEPPSIVRLVPPDRGFEERESFGKLLACVEEGLDRLGGSRKPRARQTEEYVRRLWLFLREWAAEPANLPSDKKLGELLDVPRGRIPELKERIGRLLADCRKAFAGLAPQQRGEGETTAMSTDRRREQLRVRTGEAAARFAADHERLREGGPPSPGDTFVFAAARAFAVEWAVLERDEEDPRRLLVAPVDDHPLAGSLDVVTQDGRRVRCGRETWLDAAAFDPDLRTGTLDADALERARRKRAAIADGTLEASWSEREVDADPEYRSWSDTLEEARAALRGSDVTGNVVRFAPRRPTSVVRAWPGYALAAAFAAAAVGLSFWLGELRRQLDELSRPSVVGSSATREIRFLDGTRSETLTVSAADSHVLIYLDLTQVAAFPVYRLELLDEGGALVWQADLEADPLDEYVLSLPRRLLAGGVFTLRLSGLGDGRAEVLDGREIRVEAR